MPAALPSATVVTTVTPVAKCAIACRYATSSSATRSLLRRPRRALADDAHVVGVDQVGHRPSVEVVLPEALFREGLVGVELAHGLLGLHDVRSDRLVVARIVA